MNPKTRFLVVEEFSTMRRILRLLLKGIGYTNVDEAASYAEAMTRVRLEPVDIILCAENLGPVSGLDVLKAIRADAKLSRIPFLLVPTDARPETIAAAAQAGSNGYIAKPFTPATLEEELNRIFERS